VGRTAQHRRQLELVRRTMHLDPIQAMRDITTWPSDCAAVDSDDATEGNDAFIDKRPPPCAEGPLTRTRRRTHGKDACAHG
jgi:hypothetical protein